MPAFLLLFFTASLRAVAGLSCSAGSYLNSAGVCSTCPANSWSAAGATACTVNAGYYDLGYNLMAYYPFNPSQMLTDVSGHLGSLTTPMSSPVADCTVSSAGPGGAWASNCASAMQSNSLLTSANGLAQYFSIPNLVLPTSYSVCFWYEPTPYAGSPNAYEYILDISQSLNYALLMQRIATSDGIGYLADNSYGSFTLNWQPGLYFSANTWYHTCATFSGLAYAIYYNGASVVSGSLTALQDTTQVRNTNAIFGCLGGTCFQGKVDEFRIYNKQLSASEVAALYSFRGDSFTPVLPFQCTGTGCSGTIHCTPAGASVCCGSGTYFVEGTSSSCQGCAAGTYGFGNATACATCPIGFNSTANSASCFASGCTIPGYTDQTYSSFDGASIYTNFGLVGPITYTAGYVFTTSMGSLVFPYASLQVIVQARPTYNTLQIIQMLAIQFPSGTIQISGCPSSAATGCTQLYSWSGGTSLPSSTLSLSGYPYYTITTSNFASSLVGITYNYGAAGTSCAACPNAPTYSNWYWSQLVSNPCSTSCNTNYWYGSNPTAGCWACSTCSSGALLSMACTGTSNTVCTPCPSGYFCPNSATQTQCTTAGYYCPGGTSAQLACTSSNYCAAGVTAQTPCPAGSYCPNPSTITACTAGVNYCLSGVTAPATCSVCPAGTYVSAACTVSSNTVCTPCSSGTSYSSTTNAGACSTCSAGCNAGAYKSAACNLTSDITCTACVAGTNYCLAGVTAPVACSVCTSGSYTSAACTAASNTQCTPCPAGSYCPTPTTSTVTPCTAGVNYCLAGVTAPATCGVCAAGTYVSSACAVSSNAVCSPCVAGTSYSSTSNAGTCSACSSCSAGT